MDLVEEVLFREGVRIELVDVDRHHTGTLGVWYSMPTRARRVLNSPSTVFASTASISSGVAVDRFVPCHSADAVGVGARLGLVVGAAERVRERGEHVVRHLLLHPLDLGLLLRVLRDERADAVLAEADVTSFVGDRARQRVGELRVELAVARLEHLEHGEGHALEHDVLADDAGDEVPASTFSSSTSANLTRLGLA